MNKLIFVCLIVSFLLLIVPAQATIYVGGDEGVATISDAIEKAKKNENIIVYEGIYKENVVIEKPLVLKASGNVTIVSADPRSPVIKIKAKNVAFSGFNVKGGYDGIRLLSVQWCKIENNSVCENYFSGIHLSSEYPYSGSCGNSILNNIAFKNGDYGILLDNNSSNNVIKNNTAFENRRDGICFYDSSENEICNNILNKNLAQGISLHRSNKNIITNNAACENRFAGLSFLYDSSENEICNNIANKNFNGISLTQSNNNWVANNTAYKNEHAGFYLQFSTENKISNNIINQNVRCQLYRSDSNFITYNNIINEYHQVDMSLLDSDHNKFDCNYWSDYEGEDKNEDGIGDEPYEIGAQELKGTCKEYDNHPYMNYSGWLNLVITPEFWEFFAKKSDIICKNFSIENRMNSSTKVEVYLDKNLFFESDYDACVSSNKTLTIEPKSTTNITVRLNTTNLEGYILRKITFKTEEYTKTTLVNGFVQPKINDVKIEGVDYHRNVVKGQINPFNVMLRNYGDKDEFDVTLRMGSEIQKKVYLNETETKTVPFEIDTSDMPLGITKGQVVVSKDEMFDYLNLTMFVASKHEASTLVVTNLSRFNESKKLRSELISLTHHPAVNGILLDVSCNYSEFDSTHKPNNLCEAIKNQIEAVIDEYPNIKYLIIAGDDKVIPFYRMEDGTKEVFTRETGLPDESKYYKSDHYPNPLSETIDEALSSNHFLTDDFYSRLDSDRVLAVGRLVEKPDEIIRAIDMFFNNYQLTPKSIFVTSCETPGYEFMYDCSEECYQEWCKRIEIATDKSKRINTTFKYRYKKSSNYGQPHEIIARICNSSVAAIFLHANYDQFEVPPGEGKGGGERGYLEAGELKTLNGSFIYTIGCHAGLTIPNVTDLSQSFLSHGTIAYIAPTGYGLGGVITVAGHERLLEYLTKRIARGEDVGFALLNAKNDYYLDNFHMDTVDDKVLRSLMLYGFPMYTVRLDSHSSAKSESACATPLLSQAAQKRSIATLSGDTFEVLTKEDKAYNASNITLDKITIILEPTCNVVKTENGTYYTYKGYTTEAGMPILPKATLYFIRGEKEIRGMVLRSAKFDVKDTTLVVETFAVSGAVGRSYNFTGWYPTIPFTLNSIEDRQSIVTASAQYKLIKRVSINAWQGTIRLFNETVLEIFRVPEGADREKPVVSVAIDTGTVTVKAEDNAGIYDVLITYLGPGNRTWASKTMDKQDRGKLSVEYRIPVKNTAFFVQVVDVDGNVEIDDNNGDYYVC
jgi:nitrous oxidase accessory protein